MADAITKDTLKISAMPITDDAPIGTYMPIIRDDGGGYQNYIFDFGQIKYQLDNLPTEYIQPVKTVSGEYTVTPEDLGYLLRVDDTESSNIYVPKYPALPIGWWCDIEQYGTGSVYVWVDIETAIESPNHYNKLASQYSIARARVTSEVTVQLNGELNGTGSVGWIEGPPRIRRDGWTMEIDMFASRANGTIDLTKLVDSLVVTSEGYSCTAGNPGTVTLGTVTRTLTVTRILRRAYNLQAQDQIDVSGDLVTLTCALSEPIYDDDKDGGAGTSGTDPKFSPQAGWWIDGVRTAPPENDLDVTNNSEEDYPLPNVAWNIPPFLISSDYSNTFPLAVVGAAARARNGNLGIAGIKFVLTGVGNSSASMGTPVSASGHVETRVVTDITVATGSFATLRTLPSIQWTVSGGVSDSGFTAKEKVRKDFLAYPVLGDTPLDSSTFTPWNLLHGSVRPWSYTDICDKSANYGRGYVLVDRTSGDDGTVDTGGVYTPGANGGIVYTDRATAIAGGKAFKTVQRALYVMQQYSGANFGRTDCGSHYVIAFGSGSFDCDMPGTSANPPRITFTKEDCGVQDVWTFFDRSASQVMVPNASTGAKCGTPLTCNMIPLTATGTGNGSTCWDLKDGASATVHFWNRNTADTGVSDTGNPLHKGAGYYYITGCTYTAPGALLRAPGTNNATPMLIRDTDISANNVAGAPFVANGVFVGTASQAVLSEPNASGNSPKIDGCVAFNVAVLKHNGSGAAQGFDTVRTYGSAYCNVMVEGIQASSQAGMGINRDGNVNATKNHYWYNIGLYGENLYRLNTHYEDATTMTGATYPEQQLKKGHWLRGSVIGNINLKGDVFAQNANNIHTWNALYHVGFGYNCFLTGDAQWAYTPGRGVHVGETFQRGEFVTSYPRVTNPNDPVQVEAAYAYVRTQFASWKASTALGGSTTVDNYIPAPGGELIAKMPANQWPCKFDIKGQLRKNDGSGALGPLKAAAE